MPVLLTKEFTFEAAHWLPKFPEGHKCRRLHGHSFNIAINVKGEIDPETGILMDFGDIKRFVKPYIEMMDHWCLNEVGEKNDIELLKNPTSENIGKWLFEELKPNIDGLSSVLVRETCTCACEYFGE